MTADVVLVGGGLANALIAFRLKLLRPELKVVLIERGALIGGNHTWCFHTTDLASDTLNWLAPLIERSWSGQQVRFPGHSRCLTTGYHCITSEQVHRVLAPLLAAAALLDSSAVEVLPDRVRLALGEVITAPLVIDGRGLPGDQPLAVGYQKFLGLEVETEAPHGLDVPIIMDARVPQADGYRFIYTLPLAERRLLIEDTYYSDTPSLDRSAVIRGIADYARTQEWRIACTLREEQGVLPITLAGDIEMHWSTLGRELPRSGVRAWLFHATTGYSLPLAAALADAIARSRELKSRPIASLIETMSRKVWSEQGFFRLLNRMLFLAATPAARVRVLERFYRLPQPLIERFYAGHLTGADKARIVLGRPPVPLRRALRCIGQSNAWAFDARHRPLPSEPG